MSSSAAEKIVKKLARLPSNTVCANCGTSKKSGFSTVCIKYFTFVCNNCKSSHQAISHRCKSLTMSSWTLEEAAELKNKGNDYARRTWLKNAPPIGQGGRPREGDHVDVFKRFVVNAYERKKYYGEDEGINGVPSGHTAHVTTAVSTTRVAAPTVTRAPVRKAVSPPAPAPAVADLLDFTSMPTVTSQSGIANNSNTSNTFEVNFDAFAPVASMPESRPSTGAKPASMPIKNDPFQAGISQTATVSNSSTSTFEANFDAFAPVASMPASRPSTGAKPASTPIKNDPFQAVVSQTAAVPICSTKTFEATFDAFAPVASVQASRPSTDAKTFEAPIQNDPFQPHITQTSATLDNSNFNFINKNNIMAAPSAVPPAPAPPAIKKVMNNHDMSQKSSLISSICMPSPSNIPQGNHNMGMNMGWNSISSNMNQNSFGGLGNMQSLQQQQMNMMNGMCMNNNNMSAGMMNNNNNNMMMGNSNNSMMMMNNNNNSMMTNNNHNNPTMSNQRQTFMNGNNFGGVTNNTNVKSKDTMHSLQMNSSSMSGWSSGYNK